MNSLMVDNWNAAVKPQDKVYHLGDVAVGVPHQHEFEALMKSLNGHKRLILGNHDNLHQPAYKHFERIELWTGGKFKQYGFVASHIPLRTDQMRDGSFNVHGHIHQNLIHHSTQEWSRQVGWYDVDHGPDQNYINVCVEHTNYKPVNLDEIIAIIESRSA
jgi:calcineurin-like phosphoesterase family protein